MEQWIINIVQRSVPTEFSVGPFTTPKEASDWLKANSDSNWMRIQTVKLYNPKKGVSMTNWQQAVEEVLLLTYNYKGMKIWLNSPNKSLQNRVPQDMIDNGQAEEVYALAESLTGMIAT